MKYLLPFALLIILQSCQMKTGDLNGDVESFKSLKYEAVEKFGEVTKGRPLESADYPYELTMANVQVYYDTKGEEQKIKYFTARGGIEMQVVRQEDPLKFDLFNGNGDFQGRIIFDHSIYPKTTSTYDHDGALMLKTLTEYNNSGTTAKEQDYNHKGEWAETREFQYDESNRVTVEKHTTFVPGNYWNDPDTTTTEYTYKYNENDDIIECLIREKRGEFLVHFDYTYDQQKNWIVCITRSGVKPVHYYERTITYR